MQSRRMSMVESLTNIVVGYCLAVGSQYLIFGWMGLDVPMKENMIAGAWLTVLSIVRSYSIRRFFNLIQYGRK